MTFTSGPDYLTSLTACSYLTCDATAYTRAASLQSLDVSMRLRWQRICNIFDEVNIVLDPTTAAQVQTALFWDESVSKPLSFGEPSLLN